MPLEIMSPKLYIMRKIEAEHVYQAFYPMNKHQIQIVLEIATRSHHLEIVKAPCTTL